MTWLKHFAAIAGCTKDDPHIVLLDGHESHKTLEAIDFARMHGIILLTFPPHCTHRLQPLARTYFKSLKSAFSRSCDNWLFSNKGRAITQYNACIAFACIASKLNEHVICSHIRQHLDDYAHIKSCFYINMSNKYFQPAPRNVMAHP